MILLIAVRTAGGSPEPTHVQWVQVSAPDGPWLTEPAVSRWVDLLRFVRNRRNVVVIATPDGAVPMAAGEVAPLLSLPRF